MGGLARGQLAFSAHRADTAGRPRIETESREYIAYRPESPVAQRPAAASIVVARAITENPPRPLLDPRRSGGVVVHDDLANGAGGENRFLECAASALSSHRYRPYRFRAGASRVGCAALRDFGGRTLEFLGR